MLMTPLHFTISTAFLLGLAGLAFHRTHLLSALLCLEGMMLSLFLALSLWALEFTSASFSPTALLLLAFSACEASAGLALLVATARTHGSDHLQTLSLLQC
uniref:NADH-ubiquinone oxidoreductase chain 4L n=1 Tax=Trimma cana TaxID=1402047 RepID=A0A455TNQ2_9GOBI|nr:NADH dehydrogenase subunit 4L [Trimma cana]